MLTKFERIEFTKAIQITPPGRQPTLRDAATDVLGEIEELGIRIGRTLHTWAGICSYREAPIDQQPIEEELDEDRANRRANRRAKRGKGAG